MDGVGVKEVVLGVFFFLLLATFPFEGFSMSIDLYGLLFFCYTLRRISDTLWVDDYTCLIVVKWLIVSCLSGLIFLLV
jgi:hypothetical protein